VRKPEEGCGGKGEEFGKSRGGGGELVLNILGGKGGVERQRARFLWPIFHEGEEVKISRGGKLEGTDNEVSEPRLPY